MMSDKYFACILSVFISLIFFITILTIDNLNGPVFFTANTLDPISASTKNIFHHEDITHQASIHVLTDERITKPALIDIVDTQTNEPLKAPPTVSNPKLQFKPANPLKKLIDQSELNCLALNNYYEARGESKPGQRAVANVVLNRVKHKGFPDSICAVVKQGGKKLNRCQFSWWCDGLSDEPHDQAAWQKSLTFAKETLEEPPEDITFGALWYHADYVTPYWRISMNQGPKIGKHIFYSSKRQSAANATKAT